MVMNKESGFIADQLRRAFAGDAWHGDPLSKIVAGITAEQANARPIAGGHTIWQLVLHIRSWANAAAASTEGKPMPSWPGDLEDDWPSVKATTEAAWQEATRDLLDAGQSLAAKIENFGDEKLKDLVPGRSYNFRHLFHGIVQHSLYHAGQIALLKKAVHK